MVFCETGELDVCRSIFLLKGDRVGSTGPSFLDLKFLQ